MRTFFIICLIWMWNVLVRVRLKSDTVHSKFSTIQAGFSLAWVDQTFVSNLCKLFVICSPWVHPLLFSGFSPILIPSTFSHLSFIYTCIAAFQLEIQPYRGTPQNLNQDTNHTRSMQLVSYLLPSHYLLCLHIASYFCLDPETDEETLAAEDTLLSLFLKNIVLCPFSSPVTSTEHPGWRDTGQWDNPWAGGQVPSLPLPQ